MMRKTISGRGQNLCRGTETGSGNHRQFSMAGLMSKSQRTRKKLERQEGTRKERILNTRLRNMDQIFFLSHKLEIHKPFPPC